MTDGQTFYLLLIGLYLFTGLKTGTKDAIVLKKKMNFKKGWSLDHPFAYMAGTKKSLFFSHFSPLYSYSILVNQEGKDTSKIINPKHLKSIINVISRAASRIRFLTFIVFYLYFIVIPLFYLKYGDTPTTYIAILIALISPIFAATCFFKTHKKLAPDESETRWKHSFYAILMPWHAMRLADFLFENPHFQKIHPLSYASLPDDLNSKNYLSQQYRNTLHLKNSLYSELEFRELFKVSSITPKELMIPPTPEDSTEVQYCPCCNTLYTIKMDYCSECDNLPLVKIASQK